MSGWLIVVLIVTLILFTFGMWEEVGYPSLKRHKPHPIVPLIVDLIEVDRDVHDDGYHWHHPSGVTMWVANGPGVLTLWLGVTELSVVRNLLPSKHKPSIELEIYDRRTIFAAIEKRRSGREIADRDAALRQVAQRIQEMYRES